MQIIDHGSSPCVVPPGRRHLRTHARPDDREDGRPRGGDACLCRRLRSSSSASAGLPGLSGSRAVLALVGTFEAFPAAAVVAAFVMIFVAVTCCSCTSASSSASCREFLRGLGHHDGHGTARGPDAGAAGHTRRGGSIPAVLLELIRVLGRRVRGRGRQRARDRGTDRHRRRRGRAAIVGSSPASGTSSRRRRPARRPGPRSPKAACRDVPRPGITRSHSPVLTACRRADRRCPRGLVAPRSRSATASSASPSLLIVTLTVGAAASTTHRRAYTRRCADDVLDVSSSRSVVLTITVRPTTCSAQPARRGIRRSRAHLRPERRDAPGRLDRPAAAFWVSS